MTQQYLILCHSVVPPSIREILYQMESKFTTVRTRKLGSELVLSETYETISVQSWLRRTRIVGGAKWCVHQVTEHLELEEYLMLDDALADTEQALVRLEEEGEI